jgi:2-polyprenyl-3-methyl-5-hydroxy-6-metoxy-1,4-benzoquinol methylase
MKTSRLKTNPKSKILEKGYINVYSELNGKEKKQLSFQREYKRLNPEWDQTNIILNSKFEKLVKGFDKVRVLDAGCGNGNYVIDEQRALIDWAAGVDADTGATRNNICLDEIRYSNLEKIPYPDNEFEVVVSLWVAEHLKNPDIVLKELNRVLRNDGKLILVTPNANCWLVFIRRLLGNSKLNRVINKVFYGRNEIDVFPTYYRANSVKTMKRLLSDSGFKNVDITLNYEPSYTAFNKFFFSLFNIKEKIAGKIMPELMHQHLIVTAEK